MLLFFVYILKKIIHDHLDRFKWLSYSAVKQGYYCKHCALFAMSSVGSNKCNQKPGKLVSEPLKNFHKLTGRDGYSTPHELTSYHKSSLECSQNFLRVSIDPALDVRNQVSSYREQEVSLLHSSVPFVILCI